MRRCTYLLLFVLVATVGVACGEDSPGPGPSATALAVAISPVPSPTPTSEPTATPTPNPTQTPRPTATPTPKPTATPTPNPRPTATPTPPPTPTPEPTPTPTPAPLSASQIFTQVSPAVAFIETSAFSGSGVLIQGGYVVTNAHVVWPFEKARVVFPDGSEFPDAPVLSWDFMGDLAVIGPVDTEIAPLELVNGEGLIIGSDVLLIGYPGEAEKFPQPTISRGLLSRYREWEAIGMTYFQTDAPVAGGQSGGVLVSEEGEVIGITGLFFTEAQFGLVASAADVLLRVEGLIAGEDVAGLGDRRLPQEGGMLQEDVTLDHGLDHRVYVLNEPEGTDVNIRVEGANDAGFTLIDVFGNALVDRHL